MPPSFLTPSGIPIEVDRHLDGHLLIGIDPDEVHVAHALGDRVALQVADHHIALLIGTGHRQREDRVPPGGRCRDLVDATCGDTATENASSIP